MSHSRNQLANSTHMLQPYHLFPPAASQSSQDRARVFHEEGTLAVLAAAPIQTHSKQKQEQKAQETVAACAESTYTSPQHTSAAGQMAAVLHLLKHLYIPVHRTISVQLAEVYEIPPRAAL